MTEVSAQESERLGQLMGSAINRWNSVLSPVIFVLHNQEHLHNVAGLHAARGVEDVFSTNAGKEILERGAHLLPDNFVKDFVSAQQTHGLAGLTAAVSEGALVFGHAILDDVVLEALRICANTCVEPFLRWIEHRKVPLSEMRSKSASEITSEKLEAWFKEQSRESLLKKLDSLFACSNVAGAKLDDIIDNYSFERSKVEELDNLRHSIVHRATNRPVTFDDLNYLRLTTNFSLGLPMRGLQLRPSVKTLVSGMGLKIPWPEGA